MAGRKKEYTSKAVVNSIRATSRASIQIDGKYYTLEYTEERLIPTLDDIDVTKERKLLWDTVNEEVDNQIEEVYKIYEKIKK